LNVQGFTSLADAQQEFAEERTDHNNSGRTLAWGA